MKFCWRGNLCFLTRGPHCGCVLSLSPLCAPAQAQFIAKLLVGSTHCPSAQLSATSLVAPLSACGGKQVSAAHPVNLCRDLALFSVFV